MNKHFPLCWGAYAGRIETVCGIRVVGAIGCFDGSNPCDRCCFCKTCERYSINFRLNHEKWGYFVRLDTLDADTIAQLEESTKRPILDTLEFVVIRRKTAETMLSTIEDQFGTDEECPETGETICDFCGYTDSEAAWFDICVALGKTGANEE